MTEQTDITYEVNEQVAIIKLNRPAKLNALTGSMISGLQSMLSEAREDENIKVVLLKGEGRAFCTGDDLREGPGAIAKTLEKRRAATNRLQDITRAMLNLDKPIIALLHGWSAAAGVEIALNCDLRIAAEDTKIWFPEAGFGGMITNASHLIVPQMVGLARTKELLWIGEPIDAAKALEWGLVNKVVPLEKLDEAGMEWAQKIVKAPRMAIKFDRMLIDNSGDMSVEVMLQNEVAASCCCWASEEYQARRREQTEKLGKK